MHDADHYQGLSENWTAGPVYCSAVTGRLAMHLCGVPAQYIHTLPMNKPVTVQGEQPDTSELKLDEGSRAA
jgi:DNA cross-link repair 1A protein